MRLGVRKPSLVELQNTESELCRRRNCVCSLTNNHVTRPTALLLSSPHHYNFHTMSPKSHAKQDTEKEKTLPKSMQEQDQEIKGKILLYEVYMRDIADLL